MRPEGLLATPSLKPVSEGMFNTRPKHLDAWLTSLPLGDTGECARMIYNALCECNQTDISKKTRLHLLEKICEPVENILGTLKKHYLHETLPLSEKNRHMAQLAIELNAEMATGYKIIIDQTWGTPLSLLIKGRTRLAIHRAIHYLSGTLLTAYEVYSELPSSTWLQLHQLYLYAEENALEKSKIRNVGSCHKPKSTIRDLYKRILLIGLLSPYRFRQSIVDLLYARLENWGPLCRILPPDGQSELLNQVQIRLNTDFAPSFFNSKEPSNPTHSRWLDTTDLVQMLSEHLAERSTALELPLDLVYLIALTWSGKSRRGFNRTATNSTLTITLGLNATHHLIKEILRLNPELETSGMCKSVTAAIFDTNTVIDSQSEQKDPKLEDPAEFAAPLIYGASSVNEFAPDVWDNDYASKTIGYDYNLRLWLEQKDKAKQTLAYEAINFNNINESAGGYCLIGYMDNTLKTQKVQIGELVGIRDAIHADTDDESMLNLGVIRRMKNTSRGLELGIQKLAPCAQVVAICRFMKAEIEPAYSPALVLPELPRIEQPITLLTKHSLKTGDHLTMNKHGYKTHIKLSRLIETTGVFSQFEFETIEVLGFDKPKPLSTETDKDFDSIWQLI
ncbi:MAG: hypothetical protein OEZ68_17065 [Gammaproteobacteria bacterium]|nr:hypothetical protein [Gammaproteobacteria bacterium]MDH5802514.1 hypothetical protein [Gammaproteobacteria bacterium]